LLRILTPVTVVQVVSGIPGAIKIKLPAGSADNLLPGIFLILKRRQRVGAAEGF
jgi:hypothetical protein